MNKFEDPFEVLVVNEDLDAFDALSSRPVSALSAPAVLPSAATARLHGFDLADQPLVTDVPGLLCEIVLARTTVPLLRSNIGSTVVVVFEDGDARRPIVLGVLQATRSIADVGPTPAQSVSVQADDDRFVVSAEREIVLRCGDASITLTRSGKIVLKGTYILSRSSGYNKIKGAAVDIN